MTVKIEKLPLSFHLLQAFNAFLAVGTLILLVLKFFSFYSLRIVTYEFSRSFIMDLILLASSLGLLQRKRWAWWVTMITNGLGIVIMPIINKGIPFWFLWFILGIILMAIYYLHRQYYNRI